MSDERGVRIEAAAEATGLTTRNIRAYQSLGLLPAPALDGRVGRYGPSHLARLRAAVRLGAQGFSLAAIKALFDAFDRGESLAAILPPRGSAKPGPAARRRTRCDSPSCPSRWPRR
jgi:DNA-binding transcriptional MerR regulator